MKEKIKPDAAKEKIKPFAIAKSGNVAVPIYRTKSTNGYASYRFPDYTAGRRKFITRSDLAEAKKLAKELAERLVTGEADVIELRSRDRAAYLRATELLKGIGIPLETAVANYVAAHKILGGASLLDAAKYYARRHGINLPAKPVIEVFQEMISAKRSEGLSKRHIDDLELRVGRFAEDLGGPITAITGPQIRDWLRALKVSARSQNNYRMAVQTLFSFAKEAGYLPKDHDELSLVKKLKEENGEVEIFTSKEVSDLLRIAHPKLMQFLVVGAFAGLRSAEIERLDWRDVRLDTGFIHVTAGKAKTGSRRLVPISANLTKWLKPHRQDSGLLCQYKNITNELLKLARRAKVKWKHNALRHSFISYRLAEVQSAAQVALEAGNSPQMIFEHYRELVTPKQAKEWFALTPESVAQRGSGHQDAREYPKA